MNNQLKPTLILLGYDYVNALRPYLELENLIVLITKKNTIYFKSDNLKYLKEILNNRLIISENPDKDIDSIIQNHEIYHILTLGWRRLLDVTKLEDVRYLINVHPALLPEYKGYHPVPYVITNQEKIHGITAHLINDEMDAGEIIIRKEFPINPFSTLASLQDMAVAAIPNLLEELFAMLIKEDLTLRPNQKEKTVVVAPRRKPEDSEIELTDSVEEMFHKVKASDQDRFPAYFIFRGEKVFIQLRRDAKVNRENPYDV